MFKFILSLFTIFFLNHSHATNFSDRTEVQDFINNMSKKHNFNKQELTKVFSNFESSSDIINKISRPYEESTWTKYEKHFLTPKRISEGAKFWLKNKDILDKVSKQYNVPAEIIVSILGVETFYNQYKGTYPVLQALSTLAFDYPKRATFFKKELEQFLLLSREQKLNPTTILGSYAGAMGASQFIPSSYRNYAVDFVNAGSIDLNNNINNAIASIANYLAKNGWDKDNSFIAEKCEIDLKQKLPIAKSSNPIPEKSLTEIKKLNLYPKESLNNIDKFALVEFSLDNNQKEYWLTSKNFYSVTRYNHSSNYALAVFKLSQEIKKQYTKTT